MGTVTTPDRLQEVRQTLTIAQYAITDQRRAEWETHNRVIGRLIDDIDRQHPFKGKEK